MLLEKHAAVRKGRLPGRHGLRSNLRWCSDGLEFTCWNGEVIRLAFIIDAFDREIAWTAVANACISGLDVRDMMLEAGMSQAFVKTLKRDYISISALPDAKTALRLMDGCSEDYNEIYPHSALKIASPR